MPGKSRGTRPVPQSPVGDGVLDVPPSRSPPASPRSADPRPARDDCGRPQIARAAGGGAARKGGTPGEGSPFDPLLRFVSIREFRALRRASKGSAPGPRPLFCKKAGQKTFKRQSTSDPSPSPLGRVIQSVREADTLAAEWHLPREWERRVGPETSRGRHHPISAFLWGSTPFLWARPKKWGGKAVKGIDIQQRIGEFRKPTPGPGAWLISRSSTSSWRPRGGPRRTWR